MLVACIQASTYSAAVDPESEHASSATMMKFDHCQQSFFRKMGASEPVL